MVRSSRYSSMMPDSQMPQLPCLMQGGKASGQISRTSLGSGFEVVLAELSM